MSAVRFTVAALVVSTLIVVGVVVAVPSEVDANETGLPASASLADRGGMALLDGLAALPASALPAFVFDHPDAVVALLASPPAATEVSDWWALTPQSARTAIAGAAPTLVGNLDGLPAAARDRANRAELAAAIDDATRELPTLGRSERVDARQRLHMLGEIRSSLQVPVGTAAHTLISLDTTWPGRAAVAVGDIETADYVSYLVPGMFFSTDRLIVEWTVIAEDLHDEQERWLARLGTGGSSATVAWIGYETPGLVNVGSLDLAREGATAISRAVGGVRADRQRVEPYVTLLSHSYGSTAAMLAIAAGQVTVDALVLIGSPGGEVSSVRDLHMAPDRVYVGEAVGDLVTGSGYFGVPPGSAGFGARGMRVAGGTDPITGDRLSAAAGHLGYFDPGSESMRNMALVGIDRGDLVTSGAAGSDGTLLAADH
ncbi:MAG: hypothetical protein H7146_07575 [Burkholderiaceae bacterium]|nr:hypothetical protein [Microbacteriaceae bacterium]